jgi:TetR/AcrR family transcriptional regulator
MAEHDDSGADIASGQDRRSRLLEAAILEFCQKGLAGARMQSIANAAGANKQLLYHYFGEKAQLEREAMSAVLRRQDEEDVLSPESGSLKEFMAERCRRSNTSSLPWLFGRLIAWEALEHGAKDVVHFEERRARFNVRYLARVREAQASGEVDPAFDPQMLALALLVMEFIPRVLPNITRIATGYNGDEPEFTDRLVAMMNELISHLAAPEAQNRRRVRSSRWAS